MTTYDGYCKCDLMASGGKHKDGCTKIPRPKPLESYQVELWRAEAVKNWAQALAHICDPNVDKEVLATGRAKDAIAAKINALLDITITKDSDG